MQDHLLAAIPAYDDEAARVLAAYEAVASAIYAEEHVPYPWEG